MHISEQHQDILSISRATQGLLDKEILPDLVFGDTAFDPPFHHFVIGVTGTAFQSFGDAQTVVGTIPREHVTDYEWLLQNTGKASTPDYQRGYRRFWAMNAARLSPAFYATYFGTLAAAVTQPPTLSSVAQTLHAASARQNGQKSLQFSFATKLLHITNPHLPIYDSQVAAFYFFVEPSRNPKDPNDFQQRISKFVTFHDFLKQEYARVLQKNLLATAIQEFRSLLNPKHFTEEKIVDSLIWAFVGLLWKGALQKGQIVYR